MSILLFRCFVIDKDIKVGKSRVQTSQVNKENNNTKNDKSNSEKNNDSNSNTKLHNPANFDDSILMYEGNQTKDGVTMLIDKLISNIDNDLFSKPKVQTISFGNIDNEVIYSDAEVYRNGLEKIKSELETGRTYSISFGYTALHASVNTIIITRK